MWQIFLRAIVGRDGIEFPISWYFGLPQEEWAQRWAYDKRTVEPTLALFRSSTIAFVELLRNLPPEAWEHYGCVTWPGEIEETHLTVRDILLIHLAIWISTLLTFGRSWSCIIAGLDAMSDILVQIIFGWPAVITSLALSAAGILWRKPVMLVIGAVICAPFAWYLSGYPAIRSAAILLPLLTGSAAYAIHKDKTNLAWLLLSPVILVSAGLAYIGITQ